MKPPKPIDSLILTIRSQKVLLDADLAELYGVPTKVFNQAVKRNLDRFPKDFLFRLTAAEWAHLKSQLVTLNAPPSESQDNEALMSQVVTSKRGGRRTLPYAFTEHGALMAASILNSESAVSMSVFVVRAFVKMREHILANTDVLKRLAEIDQTLLKHDRSLQIIWQELQPLLTPPPAAPKRKIGFHT